MRIKQFELRMVSERTHDLPLEYTRNAIDAAKIAAHIIGSFPVEHLIAIFINGRNKITGVSVISKGGMTAASVCVRDILRPVLTSQAHAFILAHNHPSGDPTPSEEDIAFTKKVIEAANIVGVPLVDHIVVVEDGSYRSMME